MHAHATTSVPEALFPTRTEFPKIMIPSVARVQETNFSLFSSSLCFAISAKQPERDEMRKKEKDEFRSRGKCSHTRRLPRCAEFSIFFHFFLGGWR